MQVQSFQIIPVIDLMHGQVVHAKFGQREHYAPINSQLCDSGEALHVVEALLELYPFQILYIADIDAILDTGNNDALVAEIKNAFPNLAIWLDSGKHAPNHKVTSVLGSESISSLQNYFTDKRPHVLSLDFNAHGAIGIAELHDLAIYWPNKVICMTLNTVGSKMGVDTARLQQIIALNKTKNKPSKIYAAGGVRNIEDIQKLASMCLSGVLVASALHYGNICRDDIIRFYQQ